MIKKIQLRGISRAPSDRMTKDGGCAESFNVQMEANETAPAPVPQNVTSDKTGYSMAMVQFVHKLPSGEEILVGQGSWDAAYRLAAYKNGASVTVVNAPTISTLADFSFTSVGNILIEYISGLGVQEAVHYYIFKDGGYSYLGTEIPQPKVDVVSARVDETYERTTRIADNAIDAAIAGEETRVHLRELVQLLLPSDGSTPAEQQMAVVAGLFNHIHDDAEWLKVLLGETSAMWDIASLEMSKARTKGHFYAPFFLRYAVKLYDGSYIYTSSPILCGAGSDTSWIEAAISYITYRQRKDNGTMPEREEWGWQIKLRNIYDVYCAISFDTGAWKELIQGIDIFASTPVYVPSVNAAFEHMEDDMSIIFDGGDASVRQANIEQELLAKSNYYLVKSIGIDEFERLGDFRIENGEAVSGDLLPTQRRMPDSYHDGSQYRPLNGAQSYNGRTLLVGAKERIGRGDAALNGLVSFTDDNYSSTKSYVKVSLRYKIEDHTTAQSYHVVRSNVYSPSMVGNGNMLVPYSNRTFSHYWACLPYAWLSYPDARCSEVEVFLTSYGGFAWTGSKKIPMSPHPTLDCAYAFFGLGTSLADIMSDSSYDAPTGSASQEDCEIMHPNKIALSEFENPFVFSAAGIISFSDEVIGTAQTSVPLSEGQYGQFPIYVFTGDGIRTLGVNSEGSISAKVAQPNLARYVALKGTILGLEQSVVFTTEKGVMLLRGGDVQCISEVMNGKHYAMESALLTYINGWSGRSSLTALNDTLPFMAFMREAVPAFDHNGARIIFTRELSSYHYIYSLNSGTWHKMSKPSNTPMQPLNSFPECLIASTSYIYDYSTVHNDAQMISDTATPRNCLIVTRPLDFDEPDVRKSLNNIRIRGRYNRGDVLYVLQGSMDGHNWKILTSRHGGSYKWFRIVILAQLAPTERISWIDVDFDTRMTNRLR